MGEGHILCSWERGSPCFKSFLGDSDGSPGLKAASLVFSSLLRFCFRARDLILNKSSWMMQTEAGLEITDLYSNSEFFFMFFVYIFHTQK